LRFAIVGALSALALAALAAPASAGIWTEIPSGTSSEITAIEYESDTRFWFATSSGEIWKRRADLSGFDKVRNGDSVTINDIEFQQGGDVGIAVGNGGTVLRSTTGGSNGSWTDVNPDANPDPVANLLNIPVSIVGDGSNNKCREEVYLGDVHFVRFAGNGRVWIGGDERQIATSQTGNGATVGALGQWKDANRRSPALPQPASNCFIEQGDGFADMFITPNPDVFYIATGVGDQVAFSTNNLTSTAQTKPAESANGLILNGTMAGDPANPNRVWAVSGAPFGNSTMQFTEDGYQTSDWFDILNASSHPIPSSGPGYDVDYAGGTVLSAGNAGYILHSINGREFFWNGADGALLSHDWRSVALASATKGAVGGINGKLVVTTRANATPDIAKPTGTISGPSTVVAGQSATFTLNAADTGGSGLNPASFSWTVAGLPGRTGNPVTFTFPSAGFYTLRVTFADKAGNSETETKFVSVEAAPVAGKPTFSLTGAGNTATARIIGRRVRIRMRGTITPPAGISVADACTGRVRLIIKKKRTTLLRTRAALRIRNGRCRFGKTVFIRRSRVGSATRLRLKVRFGGNAVLRAGSMTKTLVVRR